MSYTVVGKVASRAFRVLWALEELGLDYVHLDEPPQSDAVRAHNPAGKVPVLLVDGVALTDSTAIIQFLADKHGALTFPAGTIDRARQDGFTQFVLDELDAVLWTAARHSFILPEDKRVPEVKPSLKWEFNRSVAELMRRKGEGEFLMGDTMTVADIVAVHCGNWAVGAKFPVENDEFAAYCSNIRAREAFKRARKA
ncbi:glutathione S-transferase family protein [Aliiroseovarius subalbicans]|uniref:glutathione S-transferase family protein n=1 Tax=Aliiroseovarius subalbicans TaxID=2925840 RepID=UPI001F5A6474|nr:glutathione S-transferase family protein [Aliiroseovarius subalbicans]MCI2400174.1 glutathione S-transferase family protein [Aliiroseovarius subalbicans]